MTAQSSAALLFDYEDSVCFESSTNTSDAMTELQIVHGRSN